MCGRLIGLKSMFSPVVNTWNETSVRPDTGSRRKSSALPNAALSVVDPVRRPRLPTPSGAGVMTTSTSGGSPTCTNPGPACSSVSPLPITLRWITFQFGPLKPADSSSWAAALMSPIAIVPLAMSADVTWPS